MEIQNPGEELPDELLEKSNEEISESEVHYQERMDALKKIIFDEFKINDMLELRSMISEAQVNAKKKGADNLSKREQKLLAINKKWGEILEERKSKKEKHFNQKLEEI